VSADPAGWRLPSLAGRRLPDIRQAEAAECGLACLAMVAAAHGYRTDLGTLRRLHPVSLKGMTLAGLMRAAERIGLAGRALRIEMAHLRQLRLPAVLHWDMSHFVVLERLGRGGRLMLRDPATGPRSMTLAEASRHFTGVALELTPVEGFAPADRVARLRLADLLGCARGLGGPLGRILGLSVVLQVFVLASPFYLQLAVDEGVSKNDRDLLTTLALGFALLVLINAASGLLRAWTLVHVQTAFAFGMGVSLFRHLMRLPLGYFERRHVGDLVSRFASIEPIRDLLAEGMVAALVDGMMAVATSVMIFIYGATLGFVVLGALAAYLLLRIGFYHAFRQRSLDLVHARAREGTAFIETARAMQSVKIFNREAGRVALWGSRYGEVLTANTAVERLKAGFKLLNDLIFGVENLAVVWLGTNAALDGRITIGMLFAFMAYKQQFVDRAVRLVEKAIEFRMLDLHLERLADVAHATPEPDGTESGLVPRAVRGAIEVRNLSFRYAAGEPPILRGLSFRIEPGEHVAITGASGCGKTTLLKLMLGLLDPDEGEILIDGLPLASFGARALREQVGVVMQDDRLLSGSIADNICFFEERCDVEHMQHCAALAGAHDEIMRMPMAYDSLIGDMGSSLSGGQRQRILLARALYRRPRMLFVDEGTSNLDTATEARVNASIAALGLTRVIIAHRPETIASADRVLLLRDGGLRPPATLAELAAAAGQSPGWTSAAPVSTTPAIRRSASSGASGGSNR